MWLAESANFLVGVIVAIVVATANLKSTVFRDMALALAASAICALYVEGGVPKILAVAAHVRREAIEHIDFSSGVAAGLILTFIALGMWRGASVRNSEPPAIVPK